MLNNVTLVGRAGKSPEVRHFESGKIKGTVNMAVNRISKDKETDWFPIEAWGKQAEIMGEFVKKGHKFGVVGELRNEEWEDEDGKHRKTIVVAQRIILMQEKNESAAPAASSVNRGQGAERATANPFDAPRQQNAPSRMSQSDNLDMIFADDLEIPF